MNSIPSRLLAILLSVAAIVIISLSAVEYYYGQQAIDQTVDREMSATSKRLLASLKSPVKRGNNEFVHELIHAQFPESNNTAIFVWRGDKEELICGTVRDQGRFMEQTTIPAGTLVSEVYPIQVGANQTTVGQLEIAFDRSALEAALHTKLLSDISKLILTSLLLLAIMVYIINRSLVGPLTKLRESMIEIEQSALGQGNPDAWHHLETNKLLVEADSVFPELKQMASVYQSMLDTVVKRQEVVQIQEENLRITFDSIGDAVISTNAVGIITRMNPIAEDLTGWDNQEAQGQSLDEVFKIINAVSRDPIDSPLQRILETGQIVGLSNHTTLVARDGSERQIADSAAPIRDNDNEIKGIVLVFRDISEDYEMRNAYEKERMRNLNILHGTNAGTWDWNIETGELVLNERWAEIMGYSLKELQPIGIHTWEDHLHPEDLAIAQTKLKKHLSGESDFYDTEFRQQHKDGHWVWVYARGQIVQMSPDGNALRMSGTHLDITERKQAEETLKSTLNLMQSVFDAATQACIVATGPDGMINVFNSGAERMLGYSADEVIGKANPIIFHDPDEVQRRGSAFLGTDINTPINPEEYLAKLVADGHDEQEWPLIRKDGSRVLTNLCLSMIKNSEGIPTGFLGVAMDISERKQAEQELSESRRMLHKVIDSIPVRVFWKDTNCIYLGSNQLFAQDAGLNSEEELVGRTDYELAWPEQAKLYQSDDKSVMASGKAKLDYEEPQTRPDGSVTWLRTSKIPLRDETGKVVGLLGTYEDISERKKSEEELVKAKENAEAANKAKDDFLAVMSHEMRTPLNPILGFADLMRQSTTSEPEVTYLDTIISSANRQLNLIDDILDYMRISSGRVDPSNEPVNLVDLCKGALHEIRPSAKDLTMNFVNGDRGHIVPEDFVVETDIHMLRRILDNLLGNACKYTRAGAVTLSLSLAPDTTDYNCIITVKDTGIGIDEETRQKLFDAFSQADSSYTRTHEGLGLGLAICNKLLGILGGTITVESEIGKGSCFTVNLPLKVSRLTSHNESPNASLLNKRSLPNDCKVLIVDDKEDNLKIAQTLVQSFGAGQIALANNGEEAVNICKHQSFDVILMDLAMPIMNGLEAARLLRDTDNPNSLTPIIAVTADVTRDIRATCSKSGIRQYVSKPINTDTLFQAIQHSLNTV